MMAHIMTYDEMIAVIEAAKRGEEIEYRECERDKWRSALNPKFDFHLNEYRAKPKPKYKHYIDLDGTCMVEIKALEDAVSLIDEIAVVDADWPILEALKELLK